MPFSYLEGGGVAGLWGGRGSRYRGLGGVFNVNNFGFGLFLPIVAAWSLKHLLFLGDKVRGKRIKRKVLMLHGVY